MSESTLRVRVSAGDAHYGGNLVDGAYTLGLFGDIATEIMIKEGGDESLFIGYESIQFTAPVYAGDFIRATGKVIKKGSTSRTMEFVAQKEAVPRPDISGSAADFLEEPIVVAKAVGTCIITKDKWRK